jgi:acyl-CoA synthetase (AMP-forming)/AMP-acid ligase II
MPDEIAIASPLGKYRAGQHRPHQTVTFQQLEQDSNAVAAGLQVMGMQPGHRIVMLVRFGPDFIALVFALLKTGVTLVLIDPGMGRGNLVRCIAATNPDGFVAIPAAQAVRALLRSKFPKARLNVTVGPRFGVLPQPTLAGLRQSKATDFVIAPKADSDPAALIYTTGSTGPPKGVLYTHGTFNHQIDQLVEHYHIQPGGKDLSGFPLFGLFNAVMGTTTIIPDMDPTRPADVDPPRLLDAIDQWQIDQSFGSPALWTRVGQYCQKQNRTVPSLRRILSAGAPVPPHVLENMRAAMHPDGEIFTPYGATEALPVASIESRAVLSETADACRIGHGTCVGHRFSGIDWKVIDITDAPLHSINEVTELPIGVIGELMVRGPVVTKEYLTRTDQNALHKVQDGDVTWHRMGDVGYIDDQQRFWFCGRKSHRVQTDSGNLFTEQTEGIVNSHPKVYRSAMVGVGPPGDQTPVVLIEPWPEFRTSTAKNPATLVDPIHNLLQQHSVSRSIRNVYVYPKPFPVDIRHNAKIFREQLVPYATERLAKSQR